MRAVSLSHIICGTNANKNFRSIGPLFSNRPHFLTQKMYINYFIKYNIWNKYSNAITLVLSKTLYFTLFIENTKMHLSKVFLKRLAFFDFKLDPYPKSGHCASFWIHAILTIKGQKLRGIASSSKSNLMSKLWVCSFSTSNSWNRQKVKGSEKKRNYYYYQPFRAEMD